MEQQREFLLSLPDVEICELWNEEKSLISKVVLQRLNELQNQMHECGLGKMSLGEVVKHLGVVTPFTSTDLLKALDQFVHNAEEQRQKALLPFSRRIEELIAVYLSLETSPSVIKRRIRHENAQILRRYVEDWAINHSVIPQGTHQIDALGQIDFNDLPNGASAPGFH